MKVTIRVETTTFETTQQGEKIDAGEVKRFAKMYVDEPALVAIEHKPEPAEVSTPIDESFDPLEDLNYTDVAPEVLAREYDLENMVPANILAAE